VIEFSVTDLTVPVRTLLDSHDADPTAWTTEQLRGGYGNPVTAGIYRVAGTADEAGEPTNWRMVLKICHDPAKIGLGFLGTDERHWNYWKREPQLYASRFFDHLPDYFRYPKCYSVVTQANGDIWMWLEDLGAAEAEWNERRAEDLAYRLGRFNGVYLGDRPMPSDQVLIYPFARSWIETGMKHLFPYVTDPLAESHFWEHAGVVTLLGAGDDVALRTFLNDLDRHLTALDRLPQTLCHRDVWPTNLMWPEHSRDVLIDWGMTGVGAVGEDLVQPTWWAAKNGLIIDLVHSYLMGLRDAGWSGDETLVRYGWAASFAVRMSVLLIGELHGGFDQLAAAPSGHEAARLITSERLLKAEVMARETRRAANMAMTMAP
jgi:hypothetical protein